MFTGIIKAKGQIESSAQLDGLMMVTSPIFAKIKPELGASMAIDGVCLTVSQIMAPDFSTLGFDLGLETLKVTLLGQKKAGDEVNIEPALCAGVPMDGHVVQGHIDGLGTISKIERHEKNLVLHVEYPKELSLLVVKKGAIAINGVSLTINDIDHDSFNVCLIPHTLAQTCFSTNKVGDKVHLETDIMGRYLARMLQNHHVIFTNTFEEQGL